LPTIRFSDLPRAVWEHLLARVAEREISFGDLSRLQDWVRTGPSAPNGADQALGVEAGVGISADAARTSARATGA
jgi:hypothetical protein